MLGKCRVVKTFSLYGSGIDVKFCHGVSPQASGALYYLLNSFCKIPESPELPSWISCPQGEHTSVTGLDDDFILPCLVNRESNRPHCQENRGSHEFSEADHAVNKISGILKASCFDSPEAVVHAIDGCDVDVSKNLVDVVLKRFSNEWVPAFGFFQWANTQVGYSHSSDSYDTMVDILGKAKQFDLMWYLVDKMAQGEALVSMTTFCKVMRRLAGAGQWMDAIDVFHRLEHFGLKKDTAALNILLDSLCKERSVEHAQVAFDDLRHKISPDANSFNILIHGWCKARKLDKAHSTMEEMKKCGSCPCAISYTSLIEAYCRDKNFRKVESLLGEMQDRGILPTVVTYTIVMHALGKAKLTHQAVEVFEKMKENGCAPDTSFYNSLIYIFGKAGRVHDAHDVYKEMTASGTPPNVTTYTTLISLACERSQEDQALHLLKEMEESSCKPDLKTYASLLKLCCKKKRMKTIQFLLRDMFTKNISLDLGTYTLLVQGLCRSGKLEQSCLFFEEMVLKGFLPRDQTYALLMEELEKKNMEKEKKRIQELMVPAEYRNDIGA